MKKKTIWVFLFLKSGQNQNEILLPGSKFGRRQALVMMAVPDIIGWILIASSQNLPMMLIGRFLSGFCAAGYSPSIQVSHQLLQ